MNYGGGDLAPGLRELLSGTTTRWPRQCITRRVSLIYRIDSEGRK
jgi:hypothetical protein